MNFNLFFGIWHGGIDLSKKNRIMGITFPLIIILWTFLFYKFLFLYGKLISLDDARTHIGHIIFQHIVVNLPIWFMLIRSVKKDRKAFFLILPHKKFWQIILGIETLIYLGLFVYGVSIKVDIVQVLYSAAFYLFMVSFAEEFLYRGWIPMLLKNGFSEWTVWILPTLLFTLSHYVMIFVDNQGIKDISISQLLFFFLSTIVFGLLMELIKRKSQSLWIVVLLHAIYDFYGEIMLWI